MQIIATIMKPYAALHVNQQFKLRCRFQFVRQLIENEPQTLRLSKSQWVSKVIPSSLFTMKACLRSITRFDWSHSMPASGKSRLNAFKCMDMEEYCCCK